MGGIYSSVGRRDGYIGKYFYFYAMYLTGQLWPISLFPDVEEILTSSDRVYGHYYSRGWL